MSKGQGIPRLVRIGLAGIFFIGINLLLLDCSGLLARYLDWMVQIQFLPAVLALNIGIVLGILGLTLLLGRIYCSVLCPLGIWQDFVSRLRARFRPHRFRHRPNRRWLRIVFLLLTVAGVFTSASILMVALDPYGNWGRIVTYLCQPLWAWMANGFHELGAHPSLFGLAVAALMLVLFSGLAWWKGRIWCNTVCPVGTLLGCVSRHSLIRPAIDTERCIACKKCERDCKSSCIDIDHQHIDYSRCVACFDCVKECPVEALTLKAAWKSSKKSTPADTPDLGRRALLGTLAVTLPLQALAQKTDGRIATGSVRGELRRETPVVPAGAKSLDHLTRRCNACGLCISKCPAKILRPSTHLATLFKPQMDFSRGWCPPECTLCSEVCPTDAIAPLTPEEKSAIHIGHAVWDEKGCLSYAQGISCGDCARHCPAGAIRMVKIEKSDWAGTGAPDESLRIPVVDPSRCIGCGACENACPAEPLPAIHVEGYDRHAVTEPNLRLLRQKK